MKVLLTENQFRKIIREYINPSEATTDYGSILSICEGKRGVAFITIGDMNEKEYQRIINLYMECDLKSLKVDGNNPYQPFVVFKDGFEKEAEELKNIANKYDGYLHYKATEEDTRRIGDILHYDPIEVEKFITRTKDKIKKEE